MLHSIRPETKFFLTGHTGFKGTWLSLLLQELRMNVYGYALEPEADSLFSSLDMKFLQENIYADIRDKHQLEKSLLRTNPDVVVHLAAQPIVLESYLHPGETFEVNSQGTVNLLEIASRIPSISVILIITTDKVYKNSESGARFVESDCLSGSDPYSSSKVAAEAAAAAWQKLNKSNSGPKVIVARAGNVIGGGDLSTNRLIPDLIRSVQNSEPMLVRNPNASRPWQHVLDPLLGYVKYIDLAMAADVPSALNFGPVERSLSVLEVMQVAQEILDLDYEVLPPGDTVSLEAMSLELDSTLAMNSLGWRPKWNQVESIKQTLSWWKEVLDGTHTSRDMCIRDIATVLMS